jgi:hypothetical protein
MDPAPDPESFWEILIARHGDLARDLRDATATVDRARWDLKNTTLPLSLDVSIGFSGAMYEAQLRSLSSSSRDSRWTE